MRLATEDVQAMKSQRVRPPAGPRLPPLPSLARSAAANQSPGMEYHQSGRLYAVCGVGWSFTEAGGKAARAHTVPWLNVTLACFVCCPPPEAASCINSH